MIYAYSQSYVSDAMQNLGEMTEYAHHACNTDPDHALRCFIISGYAKRFQAGDPRIVSGMSGTELYIAMMEKCGIGSSTMPDALVRYDADVYYWTGYILAYYQWYFSRTFQQITSALKASDLMRMYPALHTVSEEKAVLEIDEFCRKRAQISRLQEYRKKIGYTQAKLAERSGVNLRTLQQYEIGDKDINRAAAGSVLAMAKVLHCTPEDILEI
ncbi:MAG: helix-turn-helix domain-containing protein [Lachnospiraceae bacterium]|nr:helix-turn-helix domain-containing protein [Lachnospiraceae bacterium]